MSLKLLFSPLNKDQSFVDATKEYQDMWKDEGEKIVQAMREISTLNFSEKSVEVIVFEGVSFAGKTIHDPMYLRASYAHEVKVATLIHELGHRLLFNYKKNSMYLDSHRLLNLILYDVWTSLYGIDFANRNVKVESNHTGVYDYKTAWEWALSMGRLERQEVFATIIGNGADTK